MRDMDYIDRMEAAPKHKGDCNHTHGDCDICLHCGRPVERIDTHTPRSRSDNLCSSCFHAIGLDFNSDLLR